MGKLKIKSVAVICSVLMAGCGAVDVTKTAKGYFEPTQASEVEILKTKPDRPFTELATVTATDFQASDTAKMHNAIRTKSSELGADAVILTDEGILPGSWGPLRWATGVAIKYSQKT